MAYRAIKISLEPTYKELKLLMEVDDGAFKNGLEPTYKELKRGVWVMNMKTFVASLEPTYKELKQGFSAELYFSTVV